MKIPRITYLFYDGIGLGIKDSKINPFTRYAHSFLSALGGKSPEQELPAGWEVIPTDASLGIKGRPQSATGQTALWTGVNAPQMMECHVMGFPGPKLKALIHEYSIIKKFKDNGLSATLLNAYTESYFKKIKKQPKFQSASTHIQKASGSPLLTLDDLENGKAMFMDYTHEILHKFAPSLAKRFPVQDAQERGQDFARMAWNYQLVVHEFFVTDKAGHAQSWETAQWCIETIEKFLTGLVKEMNPKEELLIITSDHGNMEDLSVKTHTTNHVPTFVWGKYAKKATQQIKQLTDIAPFLYELMGIKIVLPSY